MDSSTLIWVIVAIVVALVVITAAVALWRRASVRRLDQKRERAGELREQAHAPHEGIRRHQAALQQFSDLEADAPGAIRDDVARVRQGVELILEAVQDNPDDLPAAREQIAGQVDELSGLVSASDEVVTYARDECELDLAPVGVSTEPGDAPTTTGG